MKFLGALFAAGAHGFCAAFVFVVMIFFYYEDTTQSEETLAAYEPPTLSLLLSGDGEILAEFVRERRLYTPIDEIPDLVVHAFISAEDKNFFVHSGFDGIGFAKAMVDNAQRFMAGRSLRGASTITQQVVKNFLLDGERTLTRKIREALLATRIERALTKDQILELYLNEIFLGQNSYGVTSAARRYFGKWLDELTPAEAAYLAALPKAPSTLHPVRQREAAIDRRNYVLREMFENGYLTEAEYEAAIATDLVTLFDDPSAEADYIAIGPPLGFFSEEIRRELIERYGEELLYGGGYMIRSTHNREMQELARRVLQQRLWEYSRDRGYSGPIERLPLTAAAEAGAAAGGVGGDDPVIEVDDETGAVRVAAGAGVPESGPEAVDLTDEASWRAALGALDIPRDVRPWRPAVVLSVDADGAVVGIQGVASDGPLRIAFADVAEWAAPRLGVEENGDAILGDLPSGPRAVWAPGDVIYVAPIYPEGVDPDTADPSEIIGWSMRQIPEVNGAIVAMDPHTGRVLAMQGGFSFEASEFNRATQADRQPGSAIKPFVYAAALEHVGYPIDFRPSDFLAREYGRGRDAMPAAAFVEWASFGHPTSAAAPTLAYGAALGRLEAFGQRDYLPNSIVLDAPLTIEQVDGTIWRPRNYSGRFYGAVPFRWGIEKSHNVMTVRIAMHVGLETIAGYAERFGVYDDMPPLLSYALGAGETTLMRLTASYAMFANGGRRIEPTLIDRIQDRHGRTIYRHEQRICPGCEAADWDGGPEPYIPEEWEQVMDPITAFQVVSMMEGVTVRGTATSVGNALPFPVAGKTGTTNEGRDAWFVGFTPDLVIGCYIGYDNPRPLGSGMSGGRLCGPVFAEFALGASEIGGVGADGGDFRRPTGVTMVRIHRETGCAVPDGSSGSEYLWEAFRAEEAPYVGECPEGGFGNDGLGGDGLGGDGLGAGDLISSDGGVGADGSPPEVAIDRGVEDGDGVAIDGSGRGPRPVLPEESGTVGDLGSGVY